ncbi:hypothetical protein EC973_002079 [Apophysomyces ossiformis]|uniref:Chromo shadow domain-containing protein n=1 Tax=Apophysomyces ossiformis TaxID=679940 RepID=A0A8H7BIW7_9FUNG|nr:hypothetical protein EC973_002079 [Apophysomyces ossiformis]
MEQAIQEEQQDHSTDSILNEVIYDSDYRTGKDWDWTTSVKNVELVTRYPRQDSDAVIYAVVRWNDGALSMHPTQALQKRCPLQLLEYYEQRLRFEAL